MGRKTINYYIKRVLAYYKGKRKHIDLFVEHSDYMVPGRYTWSSNMKYIYLKNGDNKKIKEMLDDNEEISSAKLKLLNAAISIIFKTIYARSFSIDFFETKSKEYTGVIYVLNSNDNGFKIFDFDNNSIVEFFFDIEDYYRKLRNYRRFCDYFPMPELISSDSERLNIVTRLIDSKGDIWDENDFDEVMDDVLCKYLAYFKVCKEKGAYCMDAALRPRCDSFGHAVRSKFIEKYVPAELLKKEFPCIELHGDLHSKNILIGSCGEIYYIDWELSDMHIFFFDLFYLIKSFADKGNPAYLDRSQACKLFELEFKKEYRLDYLSVFILNCFDARLRFFDSLSDDNEKISLTYQLKRDMQFLEYARHKYGAI